MFYKTTLSNPLGVSLPGRAEPMPQGGLDLYAAFFLYQSILSGYPKRVVCSDPSGYHSRRTNEVGITSNSNTRDQFTTMYVSYGLYGEFVH